jgi:amino acid adenylation domain-containing protein
MSSLADVKRSVSRGLCLHEIFEQHVSAGPDRVAVQFQDRHLTYEGLNREANRLAHYLQTLGVGPEVRVGIYLERSIEMLTGILAILKAGGAYVPLEPRYPAERIAHIISETQVRVLVTDSSSVEPLHGYVGTSIDLAVDREILSRLSDANPNSPVVCSNLAYVMFTSGSTGRPKGVAITHANVVRLLEVTRDKLSFDSSDVWSFFHSHAFDFSVWEIWGALASGARLLIVTYVESRSPETFYALLEAHRVTILNQTPTAFRELLEIDRQQMGSLALKVVIFGGETLDPGILLAWSKIHSEVRLVNMYGITETTVHSTLHLLTQKEIGNRCSPIGLELSGLKIYILGETLRPVESGEVGEIYISGSGLARCYIGHPDRTAERFIADPFSIQPGSRMYRTGDLGRRAHDGTIEFHGRTDDQIKIRGHRVELREIEAVLREQAGIHDAAVMLRENPACDEILVAYVVPQESSFNEAAARAHVQARLPDYMLPATYVTVLSLPVTVNGKLDRMALPTPDWERPDLLLPYVGPTTAIQETLCEIWSRVLGVEPIGIEDDFFELGGHSLLATEVISQVRQFFGVDIELRVLFESSTVLAFGQKVESLTGARETEPSSLLHKIERLSPEEVDRLLSRFKMAE